jgi:hypothetical protein
VVFLVRLWACGIPCSSMGLWYSSFVYGLVVFLVCLWDCGILRSSMGLWYSSFVYGLVVFFVRLWTCGISSFVYGHVVYLRSNMGLWYSSSKNTTSPYSNEDIPHAHRRTKIYHMSIDERRIPQAHRRTKNTTSP